MRCKMKRILKILLSVILVGILTGCSEKDMQVKEVIDLIGQTEEQYVKVGMVADKYKELVYEYLKDGDIEKINEFATDEAIKGLQEWVCTDFIVVKQEYMTAINHANITHYLLVRTKEGLSVIYLYWNDKGLYDVEIGEVL